MGESKRSSVIEWSDLIPEEDWKKYLPILLEASQRDIPYALAGGLAFSEYSGRLRNTKDVDLLITEASAPEMIELLKQEGWEDYYDQHEYDRSWIFRGFKEGLILDLIWGLPNHRYNVDEDWIHKGCQVEIYGRWTTLIGVEHLILAKLYVFQRDRCDWTDILNILNCSASRIDWKYLLSLVGRDRGLLGGLLNVFRWLVPDKAQTVPAFVWEYVGLSPECSGKPLPGEDRPFLLDSRDWFGTNVGGETDCSSGR